MHQLAPDQIAGVAARTAAVLADAHPGWTGALVPVGRGLEAAVFRTELPPFGTVALKAPWRRFPGGSYGPGVDCRALLRQERDLSAWAAGLGVPVPQVFALHETEAQDVLVMAFVAADDADPDPAGFGRLLRTLHDAPPPEVVPFTHGPSGDMPAAVADRILQRIERLAGLGEALPVPDPVALREALRPARRSLLHLDLRPANLRCRGGRIAAVFDWSNALIGDPAFELARMAEAGTLTDALLDGYGDRDWAARLPERTYAACHLDAALLFAILFRVALPDPERAARLTVRSRELLASLPAAATA